MERIARYEEYLKKYADEALRGFENLRIYGNAPVKAPIFSFILDGIHPYDTGMIIDKMGIAVRTGTHCTMPLMQRLGIEGTVRASLCFYNTPEEIDRLVAALTTVIDLLS